MITVVVPIGLLIFVVLCKKLPYIGGKVPVAILIAAVVSLLMGGVFSPVQWGSALITGANKIAWVIILTLVGSIYAESQKEIGTMETVLNACRARFGRTPKGLVVVILFVLCLSGSLLGESVASAVVIGTLVVKNLDELNMSPEQICATIVMGCTLGSIMPPISQASAMAAGLMGLDNAGADQVINWTYLTVGITFLLVCVYACSVFIKVKQIPEDLIPKEKAIDILKKNWKSLVPISILAVIIILRSGFKIDLLVYLKPIFDPISKIPVISGFSYSITQILYIVILISIIFYQPVRQNLGHIVVQGLKNVRVSVTIQICAAFMIGAFTLGGQIDATAAWLTTLNSNMLKIGGILAMCLIGMLTGSQTTTQSVVFTLLGPALVAVGVPAVNAAVAGGHLAMAGQGMPPVDTVTFAVAGLIAGIIGKEVNLIKSMFYSFFECACFIIIGFIFMSI